MTSDTCLTVSEQELRSIGAAVEPDALLSAWIVVGLEAVGGVHLAMTNDTLNDWIDRHA